MKNREAIEILSRPLFMDGTPKEILDAHRMAISALEQGRWIPVTERLPEIGQDVLFSVKDMYSAEGCLRDDGSWCQFRWDTVQPKEHVTAWMPLPEPYQERGESCGLTIRCVI